MQYSHSRVDLFKQCPHRWKLRYMDHLQVLPDDSPDNALYLGTAFHEGIEHRSSEAAISSYFSNYYIISDEMLSNAIALEDAVKKALEILPENGWFEEEIATSDFHGFIDMLVPVDQKSIFTFYDLYDFKYSNNSKTYEESDQLHLYKYFFEKKNPLLKIRNMNFLVMPKPKTKRGKGEPIEKFLMRLQDDLKILRPELIPIEYHPEKVIQFLLEGKAMTEAKDFPKKESFLCKYCEYSGICHGNGDMYMALPKNERRKVTAPKRISLYLYGAPFSGKTYFANQFPNPLMLNTDGNIKFVDAPFVKIADEITRNGRITETKPAWDVFKETIDDLEKDANGFETVVVDLLEDIYEFCRKAVCDKRGWTHESDDPFKSYDIIRTEFLNTMKRLLALPMNFVLISHVDTTKDLTRKGGDKITAIKPNLNDKIANKIAGMVDIVGRAVAEDGVYTLSFKRSETTFGGGRLAFGVNEIPLNYSELRKLYDGTAPVSSADRVPSEGTESAQNEPVKTIEEVVAEVIEPVVEPIAKPVEPVSTGTEPRRRRRRTPEENSAE